MSATGTRATICLIRNLKITRPMCVCCGSTEFYGEGHSAWSTAKAIVAQVYVPSGTPLTNEARQTAPVVLSGGVWGRRELWLPDHYDQAGQPYGAPGKGRAA